MGTEAKQPQKELLDLGYSNSDQRCYRGIDEDLLFELRRDYFLDNLYISESCRDNFEVSEDYSIYVMKAFGATFISLELSHWDTSNRAAIDLEGEVVVSSGVDNPFFSPSVVYDDCCWDHWSDEALTVGFVDMEDGCYKPKGNRCGIHWTSCVCIPDVQKYQVGEETLGIISERFKLCNDESD